MAQGLTIDSPAGAAARCRDVLDEVETAVVGKRSAIELVMTGILASGHVLTEDLPGLGKTLLARTFAAVLAAAALVLRPASGVLAVVAGLAALVGAFRLTYRLRRR